MNEMQKIQNARDCHAEQMNALKDYNLEHNPAPENQKYPPGTRVFVHITPENGGGGMGHFPSEVWATVIYTYAHAFGGNKIDSYALDIDGFGFSSWYMESQLFLEEIVEPERFADIPEGYKNKVTKILHKEGKFELLNIPSNEAKEGSWVMKSGILLDYRGFIHYGMAFIFAFKNGKWLFMGSC